MAGKDINIPITGDAREFVRATGDVEESLEKVSDALDDMTRDTKRGADQAERAVDDLADTFDEARRAAKQVGDAGEDAGDGVRKGMKRAEEGVDEFRDEANSTAREAAASFDGSAESIADMFQEVAANAFAGFGPAGAVAGLAAAAGIGLAVAGFDAMNEAEQKSRERAAEWADAYVEAGGRILSASQLVEKARSIITDEEQYKQAQENARDWGVSESVALLAMAGDTRALAEAREGLADKEARVSEALGKTGGDLRGLSHDMRTMREDVSTGTESLNALTGEMDAGAQQADVYSTSLRLLAERTEGATSKVDEFGDTVVTLPDGKQIYIDAETGRATDNVSAIERKIYGIPDGHAAVNVDTSGAQGAINRFITQNDGKTIKIYGKYISSGSFGEGRG